MQPTGQIPEGAACLAQRGLAGQTKVFERGIVEPVEGAALRPDGQHLGKARGAQGGPEDGGLGMDGHGLSFPFGDVAWGFHFGC